MTPFEKGSCLWFVKNEQKYLDCMLCVFGKDLIFEHSGDLTAQVNLEIFFRTSSSPHFWFSTFKVFRSNVLTKMTVMPF